MRTMRALWRVLAALPVGLAGAAERAPAEDALLWTGVEVVTSDFDSIERVRQATPLPSGSVLPLGDPKLRIACDAVRNRFTSSRVDCSHALGAARNGRQEAVFIVEVDVPERAPLRCLPGARLDPRLAALSQRWLAAMRSASVDGKAPAQLVNQRNFLDFEDVELRGIAAVLHTATRDRTVEVESGAVSCNPLERMHSLHLMNFAGDPQRFVTMAAVHVNDDHEGAANAASRFLTTFAEFIEPYDIAHVATEACKGALNGNFRARRTSIELLMGLQDSGVMPFSQLPAQCQQQLRNIARTSLALPAKTLVGGQDGRGPS